MRLIELERVRFRYDAAPAPALDDVSLQINEGEFVLLAGASGSGKSTLCRLFNGLIPHFHSGILEGTVTVDGLDTRQHPVHELFARVGLVFQNPDAQLFNSSVAREIAFGLESLGLLRHEIQSRIDWALEVTHTTPLASRPPHSLSGGEQQIVAIAAILALRPRLLVLDEPFANLDPESTERLRALLRDIHAQGTTLILAEHYLHATLQDTNRLVILDHGRVVRDGEPRNVLREPVTPFRLNTPFVVRFAHESGWEQIPLSADEAIAMAPAQGAYSSPLPTNARYISQVNSRLAVELRAVSFIQGGSAVLRDVRLDIACGECVALVGKNGSGKTTLLKHLNGLNRPSTGSVMIMGQETRRARVSDLARQVGFVFQNPNDQLFKPNVLEEIEVARRALHQLDRAWIEKLIDRFELGRFLARSPFTLSEGEKKRVAFAAALAAHPKIVVLDEPTTGQDLSFREALQDLLHDLGDEGITIILATHDLEFAESVAPRSVALAEGEIVADGLSDEVMSDERAMACAALRPTARFRLRQAFEPARPVDAIGSSVQAGC